MAHAVIDNLEGALSRVEKALAAVAGTCILVMLAVTAADVAMRYFMHSPLSWAFDLVSYYLLAASFFLAFPYALGKGGHIQVDYFAMRMPRALQHVLVGVAFAVSAAFVAIIAWFGAIEAFEAWRRGEVISGVILWPVWVAKLALPISMTVMSLRAMHLAVRHWIDRHGPRAGGDLSATCDRSELTKADR